MTRWRDVVRDTLNPPEDHVPDEPTPTPDHPHAQEVQEDQQGADDPRRHQPTPARPGRADRPTWPGPDRSEPVTTL